MMVPGLKQQTNEGKFKGGIVHVLFISQKTGNTMLVNMYSPTFVSQFQPFSN